MTSEIRHQQNDSLNELLSSDIVSTEHAAGGLLVKSTVRPPLGGSSTAFLLAQVGAHAAARFAERLEAVAQGPGENTHIQELTLRSLKRMINQMKEEIARFEARRSPRAR